MCVCVCVRGAVYEPIDYVLMFKILRTKYQEPGGAPIVRITKQLGESEDIILREFRVGVRKPGGAWGWLGKKRRDIKSSIRYLTNREVCLYFKDCAIVKSHKLRGAIARH